MLCDMANSKLDSADYRSATKTMNNSISFDVWLNSKQVM